MLNFTVGPVMSEDSVLEIANHSTPYFRTPEFSEIMLENERLILGMMNAPEGSRCVFLTASGTGSMEACVMSVLNEEDRVLVVNGGSFGARFVQLCALHELDYTQIECEFGKPLTAGQLSQFEGRGYTAFLINMHETSSGVLYDMKMVSDFCKRNGILLIVDAISAFIADDVDMTAFGAAAVITGSQKALAVQPGISLIALSPEALERVYGNREKCMYLSLREALENGKRGQTPFTPAVTTLLQINRRLRDIEENGGISAERKKIADIAALFRKEIEDLPFETVSGSPSNAVTSLHPLNAKATDIVRILKDEYGIWACPNGGQMADAVFRIGHIGHITRENILTLSAALHDMNRRGLL